MAFSKKKERAGGLSSRLHSSKKNSINTTNDSINTSIDGASGLVSNRSNGKNGSGISKKNSKNSIIIISIIIVLSIIITTITLVELSTKDRVENVLNNPPLIVAKATNEGTASVCINHQPSINISNCSSELRQGTPYYCLLEGDDLETNDNNLTFFQIPQEVDDDGVPLYVLNLSDNGTISFTPTNDQVGNHSTYLCVDDNELCSNSYACALFSFVVDNINDPPVLLVDVPDQEFSKGTTIYAYALNDYFKDPDGDPLSYDTIIKSATGFINISIGSNSVVELRSDECAEVRVIFRATDPYGLYADSNVVLIKSTCDEGEDDTSGGGETSGGGGGGGSSFCKSEWFCEPWTACYPQGWRLRTCYDMNGCENEKRQKEKCNYTEPKSCEENWLCEEWGACTISGEQNRTCRDLNHCGTELYKPISTRACDYVPTCFDGVQNGDETGVDCGGSCRPCQVVEAPKNIKKDYGWIINSLMILGLLILLVTMGSSYKEEAYEVLTRLGWAVVKSRKKSILLSDSDKRVVYEKIRLLEEKIKKVSENNSENSSGKSSKNNFKNSSEEYLMIYQSLADLIRTLASLSLKISFDYDIGEVIERLEKSVNDKELRYILEHIIRVGFALEEEEEPRVPLEYVEFLLEELRMITTFISHKELSDVEHPVLPKVISDNDSLKKEINDRYFNMILSIEFDQPTNAKQEYTKMLSAYWRLSDNDASLFYDKIKRAYYELKYYLEREE